MRARNVVPERRAFSKVDLFIRHLPPTMSGWLGYCRGNPILVENPISG
jgi:hypothetical protein